MCVYGAIPASTIKVTEGFHTVGNSGSLVPSEYLRQWGKEEGDAPGN